MRLSHALPGALMLAGLSACAVDPYPPAPIDQRGVNAPVGQAMGVQPGQIAACGHAGARAANLTYPDGWQFIGMWKAGKIHGSGTLVNPGS